jgi:hypothetical protein
MTGLLGRRKPKAKRVQWLGGRAASAGATYVRQKCCCQYLTQRLVLQAFGGSELARVATRVVLCCKVGQRPIRGERLYYCLVD